MNPAIFISIIALCVIIVTTVLNQRKAVIVKNVMKKRKNGGNGEMKELVKRFIGKECLIYSFDGHQIDGVIKEISDGAMLVEKGGTLEAVNLDFIIRIREFPRNKRGKKKSVVID